MELIFVLKWNLTLPPLISTEEYLTGPISFGSVFGKDYERYLLTLSETIPLNTNKSNHQMSFISDSKNESSKTLWKWMLIGHN